MDVPVLKDQRVGGQWQEERVGGLTLRRGITWTEPWRSAGVRLPPNMLLVCLGVSGQAAVPLVPPCNVGPMAL